MSSALVALTPAAASMLRAALALCLLSAAMLVALYATRLPAMARAKVAPQDAAHPRTALERLPSGVRRVADNYNHLMEAPTVFYAAVFAVVLLGGADAAAARLAWAYVALRAAHSAVQATCNIVTVRFALFALSWAALALIIVRELARQALA
jgi:hypothetical protein